MESIIHSLGETNKLCSVLPCLVKSVNDYILQKVGSINFYYNKYTLENWPLGGLRVM